MALLEAGHPLVLDNFANSSPEALRRVAELGDLRGTSAVPGSIARAEPSCACWRGTCAGPRTSTAAFGGEEPIEAVVHFAGLKAVGESVAEPLRYWDTNLGGSLRLL